MTTANDCDQLTVIPTSRDVLEHKLLTALDDSGQVAILATEEDLIMLISALNLYHKPRAIQWANDLIRLRQEAFSNDHHHE